MNQILITKKLYVTPELKRKQALYKFCFFICVFLTGILFSIYIYGIYEQNLNEDISQDLLSSVMLDTSIYNPEESNNTLVVYLDEDVSSDELIEMNMNEIKPNIPLSNKYMASNGKEYDIVGIISIPSINISYPILSKANDALLKISVCKYVGPEPNEAGNLCIAGHNFTNTRAFSRLYEVNKGDTIEITDLSGRTLKYQIYSNYVTSPSDLSCTSQRTQGKKEITLITCSNGVKQRRIVKAVEIDNK